MIRLKINIKARVDNYHLCKSIHATKMKTLNMTQTSYLKLCWLRILDFRQINILLFTQSKKKKKKKEMSFFLRTDTEVDPAVGWMNLGTKRRVVFVNGGRRQILVWKYAPDRTLHSTYSWLIPGTYIRISYVELDFTANLHVFFFWCVSFNVFSP